MPMARICAPTFWALGKETTDFVHPLFWAVKWVAHPVLNKLYRPWFRANWLLTAKLEWVIEWVSVKYGMGQPKKQNICKFGHKLGSVVWALPILCKWLQNSSKSLEKPFLWSMGPYVTHFLLKSLIFFMLLERNGLKKKYVQNYGQLWSLPQNRYLIVYSISFLS